MWTAPRTWVTGEIPTASIFNAHLRDNLLVLYDDAHTALPTTDLSENMVRTVISDDHEVAGKFVNSFKYLPSVDATRPWHWCGGPGFRRRYGNINGAGPSGTWTNVGTLFVSPITGYFEYELTWTESNGPGESNGNIALGLSTGTRWNVTTVFDTASARVYTVRVQARQTINQGETVVLWINAGDNGNPVVAFGTRVQAHPLRGSAA